MKDCNLTVWQAPPCLICQIRHTAFVSSNLDLRKIENFQVHSIMIQQVMLNLHPKSLQSCPTLCDPMDCGPPGSSIQGILRARILEWVAISFSRGFSQSRDQTQVSCTADRFLTVWATREAHGIETRTYTKFLGLTADKFNFCKGTAR